MILREAALLGGFAPLSPRRKWKRDFWSIKSGDENFAAKSGKKDSWVS
jgi:hypothetical protein